MPRIRGGARLPEEPLQQLIVGKRLAQDLDGNLSIEIRIARRVHRTHAAVARRLSRDFWGGVVKRLLFSHLITPQGGV